VRIEAHEGGGAAGGPDRQGRRAAQGQRDYAAAAAAAFAPRKQEGSRTCCSPKPAPASARRSAISRPPRSGRRRPTAPSGCRPTPRRCSGSSTARARALPRRGERKRKVVVRKGRENYLCLLNLEDALQGGFAGRAAILAQLVARWAAYSKDGDMVGGDMPGWLPTLFRRAGSTALTDRRGECVYAGCPHYRKCFIERAARASADADLVIANHALVMVNAARGRETGNPPTRIVFDEGHHLFDAADSTFAAALTGQETIELRRWLIGPEGKSRGRGAGWPRG
jgi:ATP-dependent DNA helicase DinG